MAVLVEGDYPNICQDRISNLKYLLYVDTGVLKIHKSDNETELAALSFDDNAANTITSNIDSGISFSSLIDNSREFVVSYVYNDELVVVKARYDGAF